MVRHLVFWKFLDTAEGARREANLRKAKSLLDELPGLIPAIRSFEVGIDVTRGETSFDMALVSTFASMEDLHTYQAHPEHQRIVRFLRAVQSARAFVDYEF